ncbi:hypothetical protein [Geminicoccus harenae]|uniref:hypothetical protein n=1 Tax=Geminicoccus harenae TaxID=2498453 RepID=UPI00168B70B9|nr:hypothetical protein [Geminicoccus harenae]
MSDDSFKRIAMKVAVAAAHCTDVARLDRSAAGRISTLCLDWLAAHDQNYWSMHNLRHVPEGSERHEKAVERIVKRRAMMFRLVEKACTVPLDDPEARRQLQRFADWIERSGSDHEDRDVELIEARLAGVIQGRCEVVPIRPLPVTTKKRARTRKGAEA